MIDHKHTPGCCAGNSLQEALEILERTHLSKPFPTSQVFGRALRPLPTAQARFEQQYTTSAEIAERVGVSRAAVAIARAAGHLPDAIVLGPGLPVLWERAALEPHLEAWCKLRKARNDRKGAKWADEECWEKDV